MGRNAAKPAVFVVLGRTRFTGNNLTARKRSVATRAFVAFNHQAHNVNRSTGDFLLEHARALGIRVVNHQVALVIVGLLNANGFVINTTTCNGGIRAGHFERSH